MKAVTIAAVLWLFFASSVSWADWRADGHAGLDALNRGDYDTAIQLFSRVLADASLTQNNRAKGHYNRGVAYLDKGLYDQAIADYTEAL